METEYEAKFLNVDKDEVRRRLRAAGATLERPEFAQRRWVFDLPAEKHDRHSFARVRDEGGIVTLTLKKYSGADIDHPQESEIVVSDFNTAAEILAEIGCIRRSYQENYRELWHLDDCEVVIDSWPFIESYVEIEGANESMVESASKKAKFDWSTAVFSGVNRVFKMKYGDHVQIREMPKLTFDMPNPFV